MQNNLYVLPAYGKVITLDDQGTYCVLNRKTGAIQTIIQLAYGKGEWAMYQLQPTADTNEACWTVLADTSDVTLQSLSSEQLTYHFSKPAFSEPAGAWQVMANNKYGFGKFTPLDAEDEVAYAILIFAEGELRNVIKLHSINTEHNQDDVQDKVEVESTKQAEFA